MYSGHVSGVLGEGYRTLSLLDGDTFSEYITARDGCWVLGKVTGEKEVEFFPVNVNDPRRAIRTTVQILYDQLNLGARLQAGGIACDSSYFQRLKFQLAEKIASLTEERTRLSQTTPQETEKRRRLEALVWLGTQGVMTFPAVWQDPKQQASELGRQIASLDAVMTRL